MNNQFKLLLKKRFAPFFCTQFLGAFNDNVFKNAVIILIAFNVSSISTLTTDTLINIAGALFILPYFLFSATFGQLSDKYEKSKLIRISKLLEIIVAVIGSISLIYHNITLILITLFLLGTQATLFGPVKYSILPQHLQTHELIGGNGMVEMGTFVAILSGTILGGILIAIPYFGVWYVSAAVLLIAILGYVISFLIPKAQASDKNIKINWNIISSTIDNICYAAKNKTIFLSLLGISWFWFYGAFMLYQTPQFTKIYLGGNEHVTTLILACFSIGIGLGSLSCEMLSKRTIEIGLVPLSAILLSIFLTDLYHICPHPALAQNLTIGQFFQTNYGYQVVFDLLAIGFASGLYTVPLYALIQDRSNPEHRARIISSNNILNACFMVLATFFVIGLLGLGLSIPQLFVIVALLNAAVTIGIFLIIPEFVMRFCVWVIVKIMYRLKVEGIENIPSTGPMVIACNHVSFMDVLILSAVCKRPIRFLMDYRLYNAPGLKWFSKLGKAIPIATSKEDPTVKEKAFIKAAKVLEKGEVLGIFPEGSITKNGELGQFKNGVSLIIQSCPAIVVPMALEGMWGSFFSRKYGNAMSALPRRFWSKITLHIGKPIPAEEFRVDKLQETISGFLNQSNQQDE